MVVCRKCVGLVSVGDPCPMCRVKVALVIDAIY
jgi:RNA polymerase subunit RPABC4/transcription elongation factor Spt4